MNQNFENGGEESQRLPSELKHRPKLPRTPLESQARARGNS